MIKCDPRAKAICPVKNLCCGDETAYFMEGSECDKFNKKILAPPLTNADRIRAMSDEELADFLDRWAMGDIDYAKTFCDLCNGQFECDQCRLDWLQKPSKDVDNG
jgi:hypothetical protein